jgi:hypothetical protein
VCGVGAGGIIDGGTWEHRKRAKEMLKTADTALEVTLANKGKHHIADFLPEVKTKRGEGEGGESGDGIESRCDVRGGGRDLHTDIPLGLLPWHTLHISTPPSPLEQTKKDELEKFLKTADAAASGQKDALPPTEDYEQQRLDADSHLGMQMLKKQGWEEGRGLGAEGKEGVAAPVNAHAPAGEAAG